MGGAINAYSASNQPMWDISNTTTWIRGAHTFNFGFNYRRWWLQRDLATGFLGSPYTFGLGGDLGFSGNPVADFLLGYYSNVGAVPACGVQRAGQAGNPREFNFKYFAPYVQDDWKVNSRLTLNLGLRWDYRNVPYETNNRMGWRNLDYAPGGLWVADETLVSGGITDGAYYQFAGRRSPENPDRYKVFSPRVGFAWRPFDDERTVLRGGYGIFFDSAEGREIDGAADIYPYISRGQYQQSLGQTAPLQTTDSLFPELRAAWRGHARGQYVPRRQPVARAEESVRAAVVARRAATVDRRHDARAELHREQGHQPADASEHRAVLPLRSSQSPVRRSAAAVSQFRRLHRQQLGREVELQRVQHQARASRPRLAADVRLHLGEEHRFEIGGRRHRRQRLQRLAGFPQQSRSRTRSRPVGLRRRPSAGRQLRLQPAVRQRRALCRRCHGRQERDRRRLAGERHLHLAAAVSRSRFRPRISAD